MSKNESNAFSTGNNNSNVGKKNKWATFWWWFFLGGVGAHKFYEGKTGMGVLYIFTAGLFGIGLIVDLFSILSKPHYYIP